MLFFCFNAPSDKNPTIASLPYTDALPKSDGYLIFGFLLPALVHEYPGTNQKKNSDAAVLRTPNPNETMKANSIVLKFCVVFFDAKV